MLTLGHMGHQQATLNDQNKALTDSERRVTEVSVEKKRTEDKLSALQADIERELTISRGLKEEILRV